MKHYDSDYNCLKVVADLGKTEVYLEPCHTPMMELSLQKWLTTFSCKLPLQKKLDRS